MQAINSFRSKKTNNKDFYFSIKSSSPIIGFYENTFRPLQLKL